MNFDNTLRSYLVLYFVVLRNYQKQMKSTIQRMITVKDQTPEFQHFDAKQKCIQV